MNGDWLDKTLWVLGAIWLLSMGAYAVKRAVDWFTGPKQP